MKKTTLILLFTLLFFTSFVIANELSELHAEAEAGDAEAQFNLGLMYYNGEGVTQDYKQAVYWYSKSAEQGDADGQLMLGAMYRDGRGVTQDYVQAHKWFNIASVDEYLITPVDGFVTARENRDIVEKRMTQEQIAKAKKLAREWMEAHKQ